MPKHKVYGWDSVKIAENLTMEQILELGEELRADPENRNPPGSFRIYNKKTDKKLQSLSWAVYYKTGGRGQVGGPGA